MPPRHLPPANKLPFKKPRFSRPDNLWDIWSRGAKESPLLLQALRDLELHRTELLSQNDELRKTLYRLEASRERFARLYNAAPVGYLTLNFDGEILEANQPFAQLIGLQVQNLVGSRLQRFVGPQHQDTLHFHLQSLRTSLNPASCRLEIAKPSPRRPGRIPRSQKTICVQLDSRPFSTANVPQILVAVIDVTECETLQREILQTSELERLRVASELHDGISQEIVGIELLLHSALQTLPENLDTSRFTAVLEEIRNTAEHARQLAHFTSPAVASGPSVTDALEKLADRAQRLYGTACLFSSEGSSPSLDGDTGNQLLRMVQEAVCNAVKHSRASQIQISLSQSKTHVRLTVSDDGCGFQRSAGGSEPPCKSEGLGLRIMQHRASLIGARFTLHSEPGRGTVVSFSLNCPLKGRLSSKKKNAGRINRPASSNS
jgi:PAS domain S-box-containing protein